MSKYTTEVRYICETFSGLKNGTVSDYIDKSWNKIFDFDFPIWDENYRKVLCSKILKHYYTREIGLETVGLWKLKLDTKMNEIMPYYNERYLSTTFRYNPLFDADYTRTTVGKDEGNNKNVTESGRGGNNLRTENFNTTNYGSGESKNVSKYSDTPQGGLIGIENDEYLTSATIDNNENESMSSGSGARSVQDQINENLHSEGNSDFTTTKDYIEHVAGKMPGSSYGKAIKEYRENLINIDNEIIDELSDLFMLLW